MNACRMPHGATALVLDDRGHQYMSHGGVLYRVRYYTEEEWALLPMDSRPVAWSYDPELECWVSLEPVPVSEHLGRSTC